MLPDDELNALLRNARAERFAPGFSGRVLRRTAALREQSLGAVLQRYFFWMVPAAITAITILAVHNARSNQSGRGGIDAVLALQPVTLDAAYSFYAGTSAP
jgi:hypothetical protein